VNGVVEIREVPTADNISDVFSKIVTGLEFVNVFQKLFLIKRIKKQPTRAIVYSI
jgi:hypothetical protein